MDIEYDEYGRVVCAALFHNDCIYMSKLGHHDIFNMEPFMVLKRAKQGFVTENGYFVDRETGLSIAEHFNQIEVKHPPLEGLNSEDLKKEDLKVLKYVKPFTYKNSENCIKYHK